MKHQQVQNDIKKSVKLLGEQEKREAWPVSWLKNVKCASLTIVYMTSEKWQNFYKRLSKPQICDQSEHSLYSTRL